MFLRSPRLSLYLALLIIALSFAQLLYRLWLPTDGWSYTRGATGAGASMRLERSISGLPTNLRAGDILLAVDGQPVAQMVESALALDPRRPLRWRVGETVSYTVERYFLAREVPVQLVRLPAGKVLLSVARGWLLNPAPLLMLLIAFFVYFRDSSSSPARLLLLFSAAVFASDGVSQAVSGSNVLNPAELFHPAAYWPAQVMNSLVWPFLIGPVFIHLLLSFPAPRALLRRYRFGILALMYAAMPLLTIAIAAATGGQALKFWMAWNSFSFYLFVLVLLAAIAIMAYTLRFTRDPAGRAQARWLASGAILTSLGALMGSVVLLLGLSGVNLLLAWTATRLLMLAFPVAVAIAILRYRLFEIDIIIRNTVVYGVLSALLAGIYVASVVMLQSVFRLLTGQSSPVAIVLSTLTIAALFVPLRRRVQAILDRRMYHRKYDAERTISSFSAAVRDEVDLDEISARVVGVVEETMQPAGVSLWLRPLDTHRRD